MKIEISELREILRVPLPSDSVLEFIVSEVGYKWIIEDREKSNRKYRVWYDGETHKVTINCCPSYLHERMSVMVIDSMVVEAVRVMRNADVSDDVISRSYKEPDGLIVFEGGGIDRRRIALEVGFSQSYSSLRRATLWWIEQKKATIAVLLCLTEVDMSSGEIHGEFGTVQELNAPRLFVPLEYNGYKWFATLSDAFFETYRETDSGVLRSEPVYLAKDGVDITDAIPRDLTVTVGDFVPHGWLSDDNIRSLTVNFLHAIVETALNRVEDSYEVRE
ncbi:hypothetical protein V1515DRAFT_616756 [Lipomyces mesembrius]